MGIQANNDCEARLSGALIALTLVGAASYAERDSQAKSSEVGIDVCTIGCIIIIVLIALWSLGVEIYEIVQEKKGNFDGEVDRATGSARLSQRSSRISRWMSPKSSRLPSTMRRG